MQSKKHLGFLNDLLTESEVSKHITIGFETYFKNLIQNICNAKMFRNTLRKTFQKEFRNMHRNMTDFQKHLFESIIQSMYICLKA